MNRNSLLLLLCLAFCSGAGAEDGMDKLAQESADKVTREHPYKNAVSYTNASSADEIICPDGKWEQSDLYINKKPTHEQWVNGVSVDEMSKLRIPVEVCSSSGLLRIKPNGGKR